MATKATIFKAELQIADMDHNYYQTHTLTVARHPSETDERMMVRILAFACHADEALTFSKGLSTEDEPDLWRKRLTGEIELWIDLGQPDEKRIRKACGRAHHVVIYTYSGNGADIWWEKIHGALAKLKNLTVVNLRSADVQAMAKLAQRSMQLQCMIQEGQAWLADQNNRVQIDLAPRPRT